VAEEQVRPVTSGSDTIPGGWARAGYRGAATSAGTWAGAVRYWVRLIGRGT